jgi:hypothetical protein
VRLYWGHRDAASVYAMRDVLRFLAAWALIHESADEGWRAAVARGAGLDAAGLDLAGWDAAGLGPGDPERRPDAFVDGLAALVDAEKERLKRELSGAEPNGASGRGGVAARGDADVAASLDALRFEVAELRGRIESLQASVDALSAARDD